MFNAKRIVIIVSVTVLIFIGVALFSVYYPYNNRSLHWRDIDSLSGVGSVSLSLPTIINNDAKIRLELYRTISAERPLFTGPGLDAERYADAIAALATSQNDLKDAIGLTEDIYPTDFFQKTLEVQRVVREFEVTPSTVDANKLLRADQAAAAAYKKYVLALSARLRKLELPDTLFAQAGGITSRDVILGDLNKTIDNANRLNSEIAARGACLNVSTVFCHREPLKTFTTYPELPAADATNIHPPRSLQSGMKVTAAGPYQVSSPCWVSVPGSEKNNLMYALSTDNGKTETPQLADQIYFQKLSPEQFGQNLYNQYVSHGVEWEQVTLDSSYTCNDTDYQPTLATLNAYYQLFGTKPVFTSVNTDGLDTDLRARILAAAELERTFISEKYPSDVTIQKLATSYAAIYNHIVNTGVGKQLPQAVLALKPELLYRFNFINDRMADYSGIVSFLSVRTEGHARMSKANQKGKVESDYVYFMRNSYSLTLMGFSPSVWQGNPSLVYLDKNSQISTSLIGYPSFISAHGKEYTDKVLSLTRDIIVDELLSGNKN